MILVFGDGTQQTDLSDRSVRNAVQSLDYQDVRSVAAVRDSGAMLWVIADEESFDLYFADEANEVYQALRNIRDIDEAVLVLQQFIASSSSWDEGFRTITAEDYEEVFFGESHPIAALVFRLPFLLTLLVAFRVYTPIGAGTFVDVAIEGAIAAVIGNLASSLAFTLAGGSRMNWFLAIPVTAIATVGSVAAFLGLRALFLGWVG